MSRQGLATKWASRVFGQKSMAPVERARRFLEEAIEFVQAAGVDEGCALAIMRHVYRHPPGDIRQEIGQAGLTLEMAASALHVIADHAIDEEFKRVVSMPDSEWKQRLQKKIDQGIAQ